MEGARIIARTTHPMVGDPRELGFVFACSAAHGTLRKMFAVAQGTLLPNQANSDCDQNQGAFLRSPACLLSYPGLTLLGIQTVRAVERNQSVGQRNRRAWWIGLGEECSGKRKGRSALSSQA
jgi:hypothetical protein